MHLQELIFLHIPLNECRAGLQIQFFNLVGQGEGQAIACTNRTFATSISSCNAQGSLLAALQAHALSTYNTAYLGFRRQPPS